MGVVSTVGYDFFPKQNEEALNSRVEFKIQLADSTTVTLRGVVVRSDAELPFREIVRLDDDLFDDGTTHYFDSRTFKNYPGEDSFMKAVNPAASFEGKNAEVCYRYQTDNLVSGKVIFDRGPLTLIQILEGANINKIVHASECQYSV
ncbi:hypothetical protein HOU08_gp280 [Dickeya phage vB_DsoM_JA29]|uniref:Uncharacterized protein n=1 Tax=Dickeya phage vB_DsoM_JA29 TaxID=2283031 RepID=A0A384ZXQ1_9CAUD|nr:hypothetical protein HOU08_gp280 [Dickeya phage vB_DsoM_JA29]AXG67006.1 hypothetical protein JA29_280 [Dickeya phage vB_DsoM_JA29]